MRRSSLVWSIDLIDNSERFLVSLLGFIAPVQLTWFCWSLDIRTCLWGRQRAVERRDQLGRLASLASEPCLAMKARLSPRPCAGCKATAVFAYPPPRSQPDRQRRVCCPSSATRLFLPNRGGRSPCCCCACCARAAAHAALLPLHPLADRLLACVRGGSSCARFDWQSALGEAQLNATQGVAHQNPPCAFGAACSGGVLCNENHLRSAG
jgi:hypothetical protein